MPQLDSAPRRQTRAQRDLIFAERCVSAVESDLEVRKIYGGLCLRFPILVLNCGLCQALAFSAAKATGDTARARAHKLLLHHVRELLPADGHFGANTDALAAVRGATSIQYRHQTRRVLAAWVYFKRFAVSILKADERDAGDET